MDIARQIAIFLREGGSFAALGGALVIIAVLYAKIQELHRLRSDDKDAGFAALAAEKDAHRRTAEALLPLLGQLKRLMGEFRYVRRRGHERTPPDDDAQSK